MFILVVTHDQRISRGVSNTGELAESGAENGKSRAKRSLGTLGVLRRIVAGYDGVWRRARSPRHRRKSMHYNTMRLDFVNQRSLGHRALNVLVSLPLPSEFLRRSSRRWAMSGIAIHLDADPLRPPAAQKNGHGKRRGQIDTHCLSGRHHSTVSFFTCCFAVGFLGILTSRTPSLKTARAFSVIVSTGSWKLLVNEP